jgi:hypothetical protein
MFKLAPAALLIVTASFAAAEQTRQLGAHVHGVGKLDIAFEGDRIAMELHAPGADIVGFEYVATSAEDRAAVDGAVATLARPLDLFSLPASAVCSVVEARAALESEVAGVAQGAREEGHEDHAHGDHSHDAHANDEHAHDDHAEQKHDDHADAAHSGHGHDHGDHAAGAGHTEFHAEYMLTCAAPAQATLIIFGYFEIFPNARELEVQVISDRGAVAFEVVRDAPTLDLRDMF